MVKNLSPAGDMGSIPGLGGFHMPLGAQKLQLLKPMHLETVLGGKRSHCSEKLEHSNLSRALTRPS